MIKIYRNTALQHDNFSKGGGGKSRENDNFTIQVFVHKQTNLLGVNHKLRK